jgi:uncharacterized protein YegP (UPF0339 family)
MVMTAFVIYRDNAGEYRWHLLASNNRKLADSGEGYTTETDCIESINLVRKIVPKAEVKEPALR